MNFPQDTDWKPLLGGIVGSHAYGLDTPESDVDSMYFAAAPTVDFHGLNPPWGKTGTIVQKAPLPDVVVHEAAKAVSLLLKCNPSVLELLWLDEYDVRTSTGWTLIDLRNELVSQKLVRNAYLGYASEQFKRLTTGSRKKHARHILRLLDQGTQLYTTGTLRVKLENPQRYFDFADEVMENPDAVQRELSRAEEIFDVVYSPLPVEPNTYQAEVWLHSVRATH